MDPQLQLLTNGFLAIIFTQGLIAFGAVWLTKAVRNT